MADRIERIIADQGIVYPLAQKEVEDADKQQAQYIKYSYDADWADPKHYDLVLNTGSMSDEQAAKVIITAVRNQETEGAERERCGHMEGKKTKRTPLFYLPHPSEHTPRPAQTLGLTVLPDEYGKAKRSRAFSSKLGFSLLP